MRATVLKTLIAGVLTGLLSTGAAAQTYPSKPIHIIVPLAPGGIASALTRIVGDSITASLGQPVVVENKPGAGGFIGMDYVRRADPDGYTLALGYDAISTFPIFMKANAFDAVSDLTPISQLVSAPFVLQSPAAIPPRSLKDFIAYAKANPGKLNAGVVPQTGAHLETVLFTKRAGLDMVTVSYNGGAPNLAALLANETQLYFGNYSTSRPHFEAGKLVPLAVTSGQRYELAPDLPTLKESGVDLEAGFWFAMFAPPKTPAPIVERLSAVIREAVKKPEAAAQIKTLGVQPTGTTPDELAKIIVADVKKRQEAARLGNIQPQ